MRRIPVVHLLAIENGQRVPHCSAGYDAWTRGALTVTTDLAEHVTCGHCLAAIGKQS